MAVSFVIQSVTFQVPAPTDKPAALNAATVGVVLASTGEVNLGGINVSVNVTGVSTSKEAVVRALAILARFANEMQEAAMDQSRHFA